jgi:hypothetical protein
VFFSDGRLSLVFLNGTFLGFHHEGPGKIPLPFSNSGIYSFFNYVGFQKQSRLIRNVFDSNCEAAAARGTGFGILLHELKIGGVLTPIFKNTEPKGEKPFHSEKDSEKPFHSEKESESWCRSSNIASTSVFLLTSY